MFVQKHRLPYQQGKSEGFESCDRPIVRKRPIWVKIGDVLYRVTLKFDGWPRKTIEHLSFAVSSFVQHFIAIGKFKLELQSGNAQFGSNSTIFRAGWPWNLTNVRLQKLPWSKTGLVSRQVLHPLSKLQNWIWSKTGRYKTGLVSNTKIEASSRATKPKPWQSNLTSDTVEIFIQNEKAGLVPMQSRFRSRHKAGFGAAGLGTAQSWFWSRHKASFGAVSRPV